MQDACVRRTLEHFPILLILERIPWAANFDSSWGLVMEASPHGQAALAESSSSHRWAVEVEGMADFKMHSQLAPSDLDGLTAVKRVSKELSAR